MLGLLFNVAAITSGLLLAVSLLDTWDGNNDYFTKISKILIPYKTVIGSVVFGLGVLGIFKYGCLIHDAIATAAGLLLITDVLSKTPLIGHLLVKASNMLIPFKAIAGIAILSVGITRFLGFYLFC